MKPLNHILLTLLFLVISLFCKSQVVYKINATLNKICIKTGKVIYAIFPIDFLLENNYNINGGMRALVWNDNYIWTIMHTYPETILKINPDNGNIEDILSLPELGVTSTALEIQFHKDKLYISDIDGNLHILEKESDIKLNSTYT